MLDIVDIAVLLKQLFMLPIWGGNHSDQDSMHSQLVHEAELSQADSYSSKIIRPVALATQAPHNCNPASNADVPFPALLGSPYMPPALLHDNNTNSLWGFQLNPGSCKLGCGPVSNAGMLTELDYQLLSLSP